MSSVFVSNNFEVRGLAPRQAEALIRTTVEGLTAKEAARVMGVSPRTVEMYLKLAMLSVGARHKFHLFSCALDKGIVLIKQQSTAAILFLAIAFSIAPTPDNVDVDDSGRLTPRPVRVRTRRGNSRDPFDYLFADA